MPDKQINVVMKLLGDPDNLSEVRGVIGAVRELEEIAKSSGAVSYTHLTLPTIYSV